MLSDLKSDLKNGGVLVWLIASMIAVFVISNVLPALMNWELTTNNFISNYLAFPSSFVHFLHHPWTIFSYAFLHDGVFHILFNLIAFYFFGDLLQSFIGRKHIFPLFFWGSVAGAILFMLAYNLFPLFKNEINGATLIGASAGVMSILLAATTLSPNMPIGFLIWREMQLKYVAAIFVVIDLINMAGGNAGGHIAHLGGALSGYFYIKQLQNGNDFGKWFNFNLTERRRNRKLKVFRSEGTKTPKTATEEVFNESKLNKILEKISASGYESLSKMEKEYLK